MVLFCFVSNKPIIFFFTSWEHFQRRSFHCKPSVESHLLVIQLLTLVVNHFHSGVNIVWCTNWIYSEYSVYILIRIMGLPHSYCFYVWVISPKNKMGLPHSYCFYVWVFSPKNYLILWFGMAPSSPISSICPVWHGLESLKIFSG